MQFATTVNSPPPTLLYQHRDTHARTVALSSNRGLRMQQAVAPPSRSYSEVLGAIKSKVSPKWDDGQCRCVC